LNRFVFCLVWSYAALAGEPNIHAELTHRQAFVGDAIEFKVIIQYDEAWQGFALAGEGLDEKLGDASVLSHTFNQVPPLEGDQLKTSVLQAKVAWYRLGESTLPPIELVGTLADGTTKTFSTPELNIEITGMLEEEDAELAPSRGQVNLDHLPFWPVLIGVLLLLALLIVGIVAVIRKMRKPPVSKPKPLVPPYVEALNRLEELTYGGLLKEGRVKEFYVAINSIIRHYYARLYSINAEELTSLELEDWIADQTVLPAELAALNTNFQECCDRVKFAKHVPFEAENKEIVNRAYQIVELLKPQREEQEAGHVANG